MTRKAGRVPFPRRQWLLGAAIVLAASPVPARAGSPPLTTPVVAFCDLVSNPQAFDGRWIQVHGEVSLGAEDFSLREPGCEKPLTKNVWLMYGGDEETPVTFCCGDHSRVKGKDVVVRGQAIPLLRNALMDEFITKVRARRAHRVNGEPCDSSACNLYRVSATITGLFLAAPNNARNAASGFGHMGCCHLLVIYKVSGVNAERTPVPGEGNFTCSKQSWRAAFPELEGSMQDPHVTIRKFLAEQMRQHGDTGLVEVMESTMAEDSGNTLTWSAPDLLTTYTIPFPRPEKRKRGASIQRSRMTTVTRERCVPMAEQSH